MISIILPVFNCEKFIAEAIESVLSQSFADFELIISNNNSNDHTEQICKRFAAKDKRIKLILCQKRGISNAVNKAIDSARVDQPEPNSNILSLLFKVTSLYKKYKS